MTLDEQRKLLGADGDIERDCDCIARKAAGQVLDRILVAPSISDLMDGAEELDVADLGEREISNALDLERRAEDKGRPEDCHALAQWLERHRHVAMHSQGWVLAMLKWYAKASLSGVAAATSAVGRAYGGWFDDSDLFAEPEEDAATVEDERLVQDTLVAAACELSAARRGDSYGLYQWFSTTWESTTKRSANGISTRRWTVSFDLSGEATKSTRMSYAICGRFKAPTSWSDW